MTQSRRELLRWVAGGAVAAAGLLPTAGRAAKKQVTSNLFVQFSDVPALVDDLSLTVGGVAHIVVHACPADSAAPVDPCRTEINLIGVIATDQDGLLYRVHGGFHYDEEPALFGSLLDFVALFRMTPVDPCKGCAPTDPCRCGAALNFLIHVPLDGVVTGAAVSVVEAPPITTD